MRNVITYRFENWKIQNKKQSKFSLNGILRSIFKFSHFQISH